MFVRYARRMTSIVLTCLMLTAIAPPTAFAGPTQVRVAGPDRYSTSAAIARAGFDSTASTSWPGVHTLVIACGEDPYVPDALAAAGLCGDRDAPLLLVRSTGVPQPVGQVIKEVRSANPTATVITIGGGANTAAVRSQLLALGVTPVSITGANRYSVSASVCTTIWAAQSHDLTTAFVVNGQDPTKFFDAISCSAIAADEAFPVLLVSRDTIPSATLYQLRNRGIDKVIIVGGTATVSQAVRNTIEALPGISTTRWAGLDRYTTSLAVADGAITAGWSSDTTVAVAGTIPDGLAGGPMIGHLGGPLILTRPTSLPEPAMWWFSKANSITETHPVPQRHIYIFGEPDSVSNYVAACLEFE